MSYRVAIAVLGFMRLSGCAQFTWLGWTSSSLALTLQRRACKTATRDASEYILLF
jgi:hypothetical protein